MEARREGERKRREKEAADVEARRAEAEERARMKVRLCHLRAVSLLNGHKNVRVGVSVLR